MRQYVDNPSPPCTSRRTLTQSQGYGGGRTTRGGQSYGGGGGGVVKVMTSRAVEVEAGETRVRVPPQPAL